MRSRKRRQIGYEEQVKEELHRSGVCMPIKLTSRVDRTFKPMYTNILSCRAERKSIVILILGFVNSLCGFMGACSSTQRLPEQRKER